MSAVLGAPLWVARGRAAWIQRALRGAAGLGCLGLGLLIAWRAAL